MRELEGRALDRGGPTPGPPNDQTNLAQRIRQRSIDRWGGKQPTMLIGVHPAFAETLGRLARFAESDSPVLITGETGTGKELFARALYLLSARSGGPFVSVNCPQYQDGNVVASELFGHRKGSFTGALADHSGLFEAAHGGVVFLDEIAELTPQTQAMLLRALSEGEIVRVGETRARRVDVRVIAATSRSLPDLVESGRFRTDLFYRLHCLHLQLPPIRERGNDWELILHHFLDLLATSRSCPKAFSPEALAYLADYDWPGNVREIRALVDTGFHLSEGKIIEPRDFMDSLEALARREQLTRVPSADKIAQHYTKMQRNEGTFWDVVHRPYMDRELSRSEVREIVARGLSASRGSYKRLLASFGIADDDYLRFMDFLRHHRLKPEDAAR